MAQTKRTEKKPEIAKKDEGRDGCDAQLQTPLGERGRARVDLGRVPKAGSKSRAEFYGKRSMNRIFDRAV